LNDGDGNYPNITVKTPGLKQLANLLGAALAWNTGYPQSGDFNVKNDDKPSRLIAYFQTSPPRSILNLRRISLVRLWADFGVGQRCFFVFLKSFQGQGF